MQEQGRTGGWQDCFCPHLFKLASKMEVIQESVSDPSDIIHSMKKRPILIVCDDACTLADFECAHYPEDSARCLGDRKGCFEVPSETRKPRHGIDCKDLDPIHPTYDRSKFEDKDPLIHPDSSNINRYILGTRLQSKSSRSGHKRSTCSYHSLDLCEQGHSIKSMTQESMQNVRKFKSIRQDKLRNVI